MVSAEPKYGCPGGACTNGICLVTDARVIQDGVTTDFAGIAVAKPGFFAYHVRPGQWVTDNVMNFVRLPESENDPLMIIGGDGYTFETPSGRVHTFQLTKDITQLGAFGYFASTTSSPTGEGNGFVSPLLLVEKDSVDVDPDSKSRAVWLQTNFAITSEPTSSDPNSQESFINIALGEWDPATGVTGVRRGGSSVAHAPDGTAIAQNYSFSGDIASLAGPDSNGTLAHFMGTGTPNLVIGFDSTGTHNIGRDTPLNAISGNNTVESQSGATYHIGVGLAPPVPAVSQQINGQLLGYAAGFAQQPGAGAPAFLGNPRRTTSPFPSTAWPDPLTAFLHLGDGLLQNPRYNLEFGGAGRSAYIDDKIFAAIEAASGSSVAEKYLSSQSGVATNNLAANQGQFVQIKTHVDASPTSAATWSAPTQSMQTRCSSGPMLTGTPTKQAFCTDSRF